MAEGGGDGSGRRDGSRGTGGQREGGVPTPPRWPLGLSEPTPVFVSPPGAGSSRARGAGAPIAPIPRSQPALVWAPAGPSTPPLKPVCSKLFTPLGWDRQSGTGAAPGCSHGRCRGCSPPGLGTRAPAPPSGSPVPFHALFGHLCLRQGWDRHWGLGSHPALGAGMQLEEAPALLLRSPARSGMCWQGEQGAPLPLPQTFPFPKHFPFPFPKHFPFSFPKPAPVRASPGTEGHSPLHPPCPLLWFWGGSVVPVPLPHHSQPPRH